MAGIDVLTARGSGGTAPAEGLAHPLIAYFGHDGRESAVHRRMASLQAVGARVLGFTFLRRDQNERGDVAFPNVPLGVTVDRHYGRRLFLWRWGSAARSPAGAICAPPTSSSPAISTCSPWPRWRAA